jgi:hypothetical protein
MKPNKYSLDLDKKEKAINYVRKPINFHAPMLLLVSFC